MYALKILKAVHPFFVLIYNGFRRQKLEIEKGFEILMRRTRPTCIQEDEMGALSGGLAGDTANAITFIMIQSQISSGFLGHIVSEVITFYFLPWIFPEVYGAVTNAKNTSPKFIYTYLIVLRR